MTSYFVCLLCVNKPQIYRAQSHRGGARSDKRAHISHSQEQGEHWVRPFLSQISLKASAQLDPYQAQFVPVIVPEPPETTLLVYPQSRFCHISHPFTVNFTNERSIYVPLVNPTRKQKTLKRGTIVASYEEVKVPPPSSVNATRRRIHNDLLPQNYQTSEKGTRTRCLRDLIKQQS